ncbi:YtxH domain-containing protein [Flavobacterium sp.]|jgi:gas vesicle protein|uniref:YtxH domain-containing protein n=1 Tax=Flavobacterium sp. TaxID=239 RepID=UPI002A836E86|nr:YtxH domain-containing protein [Flavobacterium sp.]
MKSKNVILGVLGGLAAGAVLGILFAPDKGVNTRKKISKKTDELKENVQDSLNELVSSIEDKYKSLTSNTETSSLNSKEKLEKSK